MFLFVFCIVLSLCLKCLSWTFMVCSWTLVQCSSISNYIRLIQSIACTISLLFWIVASIIGEKLFDHLHLILIPPSKIKINGGPFDAKHIHLDHPIGSQQKCDVPMQCWQNHLTSWWHSFEVVFKVVQS